MTFPFRTAFFGAVFALFVGASFFPAQASATTGLPTWKLHATPTYTASGIVNEWGSVVWASGLPNGSGGTGLFVAGAVTGAIATSPDGTTWTVRTITRNYGMSLAYGATTPNGSGGQGLLVATSMNGLSNSILTSPDGITWTSRSAPAGFWLNVTWADTAPNGLGGTGLFVAVGYPGTTDQVMTSPDGINWTPRNAAAVRNWNCVTWASTAPNGSGGQGLFVAVAQQGNGTAAGNEIMTSPDGVTWTSRSNPLDGLWNSVTWSPTVSNGLGGQGLFVAVNAIGVNNGGVMTSPDGITWTTRSVGVTNFWYTVVWSAELSEFVVVGYSSGTGREIMTSTNGTSWTTHVNSGDATFGENYVGLAWSPALNLYVAVNYSSNKFMKSSDGSTWTSYTSPTAGAGVDTPWNSITWASTAPNGSSGTGLFVAVGSTGDVTNQVMTSPDGSTWTARTAAAANNWTSVTWSPSLNLFAAVASSGTGNRVMTSPDGVTWTSRTSAADNNWQSVVWSPEKSLFVAVANSGTGNRVMTSSDGITWTTQTSAADNNWMSVTWSATANTTGLFVAVASSGTGNRVMTSPDGVTWTTRTSAADNNWQSIAWSSDLSLFVAVSTSGTGNRVMTSPDGITWTIRTSAQDNNWYGVAWSSSLSLFVAVGQLDNSHINPSIGTFIMTSPDGVTWTSSNDALNNWWTAVAWSPDLGMFAAVADSGTSAQSTTNIGNWVMTTPAAPNISVISATPASTTAIVTWTTDENSSSQVFYGTTSSYGSSTTIDNTGVTSHSVTVTGLTCLTTYHFQVSSTYLGLNSVSFDETFTTTAGTCPAPPTVTASAASSIAQTTATLNGDITATGQANATVRGFHYGTTTSYGTTTTESGSFGVSSFTANLTGLSCNHTYHFQAYATNPNGTGTSSDATFTTSACSAAAQTWYSEPTAVGVATDGTWNGVAWSPQLGLFAAVGQVGTNLRVYTSPDGITWTIRTTPVDNTWTAIAWSPTANGTGLFVAVAATGTGNGVMTSPDGINWTARTPAADNQWRSVVWSPEKSLFVAVSNTGTGNRVMTSPDGITWTSRTSAADDSWLNVAWGATANTTGMFVAVSNTAGVGNHVMTSPDGITWTMRTAAADLSWTGLAWSPTANGTGLFAATSTSGTGNRVMTSPDGITWTSRTTPFDNNWRSVVWSPEKSLFVAIAGNAGTGNRVMTSPDGISWTIRASAADSTWFCVTWSPTANGTGMFVAVAAGSSSLGARIMTSPDGITWTLRTSTYTLDNQWQSVIWSPEKAMFVAVAKTGTGNRVMTSTDGKTWTSRTSAADNAWTSVAWGSTANTTGMFVAVGTTSGVGNHVMTSPDGITWTTRTAAADNSWDAVTWSPELGLFVAVSTTGTGNRVMTSPDGITWTSRTSAADNSWDSIAWSPTANTTGMFVAVSITGTGNRVMTSPDGITWTSRTSAADNTWISVAWSADQGIFAAVANSASTSGNRVMTSPDGITWTTQTSASDNTWTAVTWGSGASVFTAVASTVVASSNAVMTSPTGVNWTGQSAPANNQYTQWTSVAWSPSLGIFAAVAQICNANCVMISGPTIPQSVSATTTATTATVTWTTDQGSTSQVRYGLTSGYGNTTTLDSTQVTSHSVLITGLTCGGTVYHYQAVSSLSGASNTSVDATFTTAACPSAPTVTASAASSVTTTSATLNGNITATGGENPSTRGFHYGLTASYGSTTTETGSFGVSSFTTGLTGLTCNTTYHYQAYATNSGGTGASSDATFTTSSCSAPTVTASAASSITTTAATLNGNITATGGGNATTRGFNYGTTASYGTTTTEGGSFGVSAFTTSLTGLTCGTTYHYQAYATNAGGTGASSPDATFSTSACPIGAPTVTASSATSITATTVTLNGTISATGGANATVRGFNYGLTTGYELTPTSESGSFGAASFTANLTGLACNTLYHYQAYATNTGGTGTSSPDATFTTSSCPTVVISSGGGTSGGRGNPVFPSGGGGAALDFIINNGVLITHTRTVKLAFNADPATVTGYAVSTDPTFAGKGILSYVPTTSFMLPAKFGNYTVYVIYFSSTGNTSPTLSHSVVYASSTATNAGVGVPSTTVFKRSLKKGMTGADVRALQQFLNKNGFTIAKTGAGSPGHETTLFGAATAAAVVRFQEAHAKEVLAPSNLKKGTGFAGPATIALLNILVRSGQ